MADSEVKAQLAQFVLQEHLIKQVLINHINNRVQEFPDPITSTLVLMATSPMQIVFCEEGLLLFKSTHLPIFPYSALAHKDKQFLLGVLEGTDDAHTIETYHGCGKYSVQINKGNLGLISKRKLLMAFVEIILHQKEIRDRVILQRLGDIIIQRFLSSVSVHADDIGAIMDSIWAPDA
jgi:hypothetical protein